MSAALKSQEVAPQTSGYATPVSKRPLRVVPAPPRTSPPTSLTRRVQARYPLWLKLLVAGQRLTLGMALFTVCGALATYALTVNTNRQLTLTTTNLNQLQDQQQQLTTANAVFKNHLAETALTTVQTSTIHPKNVIFLEPTAPLTTESVQTSPAATHTPPSKRFFPQGY